MRIYTEVVWSWDDEKGELVRESSKSYDYDGPLTLAQRPNEARHPAATTGANYKNTYSAGYSYPKGVGGNSSEYPHYIRFIAKKSYTSTTSARGTSNGEVALYMPPDALKTQYSQGIGDVEMGGFIALANSQGGAGSALAEGKFGIGADVGAQAFTALKGRITGDTKNVLKDLGKTMVGGALKRFAATQGGQAISRATGQVLNPHKAVVYQGPGGFRVFTYTFVMMPKDSFEAEEIFSIVKFFKMRMHPGTGAGDQINSSVTLSYPDEFEIKYYVNGKHADGFDFTQPLFNIHNCFMDSFGVDYSTSGLTSFTDDNQPLTTTMTLSFKETQLLTKKDIDEGY